MKDNRRDWPENDDDELDGDQAWPHLWDVVFNVLDECWYAACYLCSWWGNPAEHRIDVVPELRAHLRTEAHKKLAG